MDGLAIVRKLLQYHQTVFDVLQTELKQSLVEVTALRAEQVVLRQQLKLYKNYTNSCRRNLFSLKHKHFLQTQTLKNTQTTLQRSRDRANRLKDLTQKLKDQLTRQTQERRSIERPVTFKNRH